MAETNFSLIDLKALSEPAVKLIEAVQSAVGVVYEPTQIRRRAKAEAEAAVILARNQLEIKDIEIRASERFRKKEIRRQHNIEGVTRAALESLPDSVSREPIDEDWVHQFYEQCQDVRNEQMQRLWGKILAGEVAKPGTYSLRCLRVIRDIQQKDADLFTRFCTFVWVIPGNGLFPIIPKKDDQHLKDGNVQFADFLHLEDMGLIQFGQVTGFVLQDLKGKTISTFYYGKHHRVTIPEDKKDLKLGCALLTSVGAELAPIAGSTASETYRQWVVDHWRNTGYSVEEL